MVACLNCGNETTNPKFCNRSCSVTFNNRLIPRRRKEGKCKNCGSPIHASYTYCSTCWKDNLKFSGRATLGEIRIRFAYQKHAMIRAAARRAYRLAKLPRCCKVCSYDRHFDVCHRQAIASFPSDTPIREINSLDNLVALCKNHHWEFDRGLLDTPLDASCTPRSTPSSVP